MSNVADRRIVAHHDIRGRTFEVERITWKDSDGLSFDVREVETGFALHNESFDAEPSRADIENLIQTLQDDLFADDLDTRFFDEREVLEFLFGLQPVVQIIHSRDPDGECGIEVYVNGERVKDVTVEDIDPGRGYDREAIAERRADAVEAAEAPDATPYAIAVAEALNEAPFEKWALG